jgi:hypothetical protein
MTNNVAKDRDSLMLEVQNMGTNREATEEGRDEDALQEEKTATTSEKS